MAKVMVHLDNISKRFDGDYVIKKTSLDIYEGEFLTLLGPSGCGKTTILRMISGLETPTTGRVFIDDKDVTDLDAAKREVNTIFQNFALFPHMTVFDNVAFGLKMKKVKKKEIEERVKEAIKLVNLDGFEKRLPSELSGGQQQRVAIARGIVTNPKVLLLDESLCSLDLKLKKRMQIELKKLQKKLGITFIYVTHDQDEALTMSDRIAIINEGLIEQLDTPQNIYRSPHTVFVGDFIGESNILDAEVIDINKTVRVNVEDLFKLNIKNDNYKVHDKLKLIIRPEIVEVYTKNATNRIKGVINDLIYDGNVTKLEVKVNDKLLKVEVFNSEGYRVGQEVYLAIEKEFIIAIKR